MDPMKKSKKGKSPPLPKDKSAAPAAPTSEEIAAFGVNF
jgi:hypothetical protein